MACLVVLYYLIPQSRPLNHASYKFSIITYTLILSQKKKHKQSVLQQLPNTIQDVSNASNLHLFCRVLYYHISFFFVNNIIFHIDQYHISYRFEYIWDILVKNCLNNISVTGNTATAQRTALAKVTASATAMASVMGM